MNRSRVTIATTMTAALGLAAVVAAQTSPALPAPRPTGRVSFYTNASQVDVDGGISSSLTQFITSVNYKAPDTDKDGLDYSLDLRYARYTVAIRAPQTTIYEAFVGKRFANGRMKARAGQLWLTDLGALGAVGGGLFESRVGSSAATGGIGRMRVGVFAGMEPKVSEVGYESGVKKFGGYFTVEGERSRRHVVGFVNLRSPSLNERSVVTTMNFVPIGRKVFVYQLAELDVTPPAGKAHAGLTYFFANARVTPNNRVEFQGTVNRGRSIDIRGLVDDIQAQRPLKPSAIDGLLYETVGGRVTVQPVSRIRVYAGYSRDKTNRDASSTGRTIIGGFVPNLAGSGFDLSASDSWMHRPTGSFHSTYVSVGRQIGRSVYVTGDYSSSLSVVQFSRSDGVVVEQRPSTHRFSGNANMYIGRLWSVLVNVDRTLDSGSREFRVMSGVTVRMR